MIYFGRAGSSQGVHSAMECRAFIGLLIAAATVLTAFAAIPDASAQAPRPAPKGGPATAPLRAGFALPPAGETRFVPNEVILDVPASVSTPALDAIAARHTMT